MIPIRAVVHDRRIEIPAPAELPDGTEVCVEVAPIGERVGLNESEWDNTPEGIAAWLTWYDSLEPLQFTEEEAVKRLQSHWE